MKNYFLLAFLFATSISFAQSKDKKIFLDSLSEETTTGNYKYYRIITDFNLDKERYDITDYYLNDQIKHQGVYKTKHRRLEIGEHKEYYPSGKLKNIKNYSAENLPTGPYSSFYENGNKETEAEYVESEYIGEKTAFIVTSYWDENGNQKVTDGNGFMIEKSEFETSTGKVVNGFKDGTWTGTNLIHKIQFEDNYKSGKLIRGVSKDANNTEFVYSEIVKQPEFPGGPVGFSKFVMRNYKTPEVPKSIKGRVFLEFTVDKDSQIQDIKVIRSLQKDFDTEAVKLIKSCNGLWLPGEYRGIKIKVKYSLPLMIDVKVN